MNEYISMEGIEGIEGVTIEGDSIEIEGFDLDEENEEQIRLIEAGMYDMSEEGIEGWSWFKKAFKKITKPFKKIIKPVVSIAKQVTKIPGVGALTSLLPGGSMVKLGVGMFKDMVKIEKATGKKIKFRPKAVHNVASMMYLKGYKEGRADEVKEQLKRKKSERSGYQNRYRSRRSRYRSRRNRYSARR